jgi:hypothetical protein
VLSLILAGLYIFYFARGFPWPTAVLTMAPLFAAPLAAGFLFIAASRRERIKRPDI